MTEWPGGLLIKPIVQWPGEPTPWSRRQSAPFRSSWSSTLEVLERELRVISAKARVLQVDIAERYFRIDGYPRADARSNGPGVILTFDAFGGSLSYPCDTFDDWQDNVRAIALALEALRTAVIHNQPDAIADAYRRAARRLHPDQPGGSTAAFQRLQEAKRVLDEVRS